MKQSFMNGCAPGAKGVSAKSGYMNAELFVEEYLPFFISNVHCTKERPVLLILDNHSSHISLKAVTLCKDSGIHLLTLPPHTSHKLQPLDRCVYGPFKTYLNRALDDWMRSNPGRSVSIYEMAGLSTTAFSRSMTPVNIHSGFRCTGIYPLDSQIFGDDDFISASVTDQPPPFILTRAEEPAVQPPATTQITLPHSPQPSTSGTTLRITPEQILPLPKAGPRKPSNRRKVKSAILTDTPEKERIEREHAEMVAKKRPKGKASNKGPAGKKASTVVASDSSSEEELAKELIQSDSDSPDEEEDNADVEMETKDLQPGVFVLVKFLTNKKNTKLYVGEITSKTEEEYEVKFMRKVKGTAASFIFPEEDDITTVPFNDIILILGLPVNIVGTKRAASRVMFRVDLSGFIIE